MAAIFCFGRGHRHCRHICVYIFLGIFETVKFQGCNFDFQKFVCVRFLQCLMSKAAVIKANFSATIKVNRYIWISSAKLNAQRAVTSIQTSGLKANLIRFMALDPSQDSSYLRKNLLRQKSPFCSYRGGHKHPFHSCPAEQSQRRHIPPILTTIRHNVTEPLSIN